MAAEVSEFDSLLAKATELGKGGVHGAMFKCVDKNGNELYSKIAGYDSLSPDASPLRFDATLKVASATKLITSIALLQCIERGLVGLDESLTKILPELDRKEIIKPGTGPDFIFEPSTQKITARHLLTHTSGIGYIFLPPLLEWAQSPAGQSRPKSNLMHEKYNVPLAFEPGTGWLYGGNLDWAGVVVRRLHDGMSLEDYFIDNIWKTVGLSAPFPTFDLGKHPDYAARLMQNAQRTSDGGLEPLESLFGYNSEDQEGGGGLVATSDDYIAVLQDLVSGSSKLLKPETIDMMFTPQLPRNSSQTRMLFQLQVAWESVAGPISESAVNHGLGGLLILEETPEIRQPKNILAWGGATNSIWFACRELGVAGFFGTQISPFGDPQVKELINAWKKDFWSSYLKRS